MQERSNQILIVDDDDKLFAIRKLLKEGYKRFMQEWL
jgi:hypothetical protein